jgi:acyl-CoA synthetase (AMP-forming)/AMP-acid ligase II
MDFINGKTVRDLWSERVALSGGETALLFEPSEGREQMVDYATLNDRIDRAARAFHDELGIEKGDTVGLHLPNCPEYLEVWYALLKLGAVSVHSNTNHTAREVNYTLDNSDAGVIITTPAYEDVIADAREGTGVETTVYARAADADTGDAQSDFDFYSGEPQDSGTFEQTFDEAGVGLYLCEPHATVGMKGGFVVGE